MLDRVRPGWWREIALDRLAMETCYRCIIGQLYGDYWLGCRELWKSLPSHHLFAASGFGFTLPDEEQDEWIEEHGDDGESSDRLFAPLADAWRAEIDRRIRESGEGVAGGRGS